MTTSDTKKAQVLAGLLAIAGFTWFLSAGMRDAGTTHPKTKPGTSFGPTLRDPRIQIPLLHEPLLYESQRNIFQYRSRPLPAAAIPTAPILIASNTKSAAVDAPLSSAQPPSKVFKYEGFSIRGTPANGSILAALNDDGTTYAVKLDECLMGQYCVRQITESMVELEDLQNKQRRTVPKTLP